MQLHISNFDESRMKTIADAICQHPVDGIIYMPIGFGEDFVRINQNVLGRFCSSGIPVVVAGHCKLPDFPQLSGVSTNHYRGAYAITSHLIGLGHERIAMVYDRPNQDRQKIIEGFQEAIRDAGLPASGAILRYLPQGVSPRTEVKQLLHARQKPTAFFAIHELFASEIMAGLDEMGLGVPQDAAVVSFGDSPMGRFLPVPLTTVRVRHREEGDLLAGMMMDILDGSVEPPCWTELPARLVIRESCGANLGGTFLKQSPADTHSAAPAG